ncbi:ATP-dependent DNA ligase [Burkholderiales bacterium JOSHI_001]|nr:ATP-dependent DNA ligase [Burkholderiales bacterium JOSHI_001]
MQHFAALYAELDASPSTQHKVSALRRYLAQAVPEDAAWALYFLAGGRPRRSVSTSLMREQACLAAGLPDWLFEAGYQAAGDLAETIAQVLPPPERVASLGLAAWMTQRLLPLHGADAAMQAQALQSWWRELDTPGRFLLGKLIGGGFRVGVSRLLVQRALAEHAGLDPTLVAQRMMGFTSARTRPTAEALSALLAPPGQGAADAGQPYPFFLAQALEGPPAASLGERGLWQAEWKYDGMRAQVVRRAGRAWLWSRGEELVGEAFPEVLEQAAALPDGTVLDGELLVWPDGAARPAPFAQLQQRANRKTVGKALRQRAPVRFVAYDLLEFGGVDQRERPLAERRPALEALLAQGPYAAAPVLNTPDWPSLAAQRATSLAQGVEGLMLKALASAYGSGRSQATAGLAGGAWWKWKLEPERVDGVLIYAQAGHGRRAGVYTDYTFAVWNRAPRDAAEAQAVVDAIARREPAQPGALQLVAFTKAYSGLTDAEFAAVDREVRAHTLERFGPVRSVRPTLVFELGFEGIQRSARHKSGVALRFPRMLRLRPDKPLHQADTLDSLQALLRAREDIS